MYGIIYIIIKIIYFSSTRHEFLCWIGFSQMQTKDKSIVMELCLIAGQVMHDMRSPLKKTTNKEIVFIYLFYNHFLFRVRFTIATRNMFTITTRIRFTFFTSISLL